MEERRRSLKAALACPITPNPSQTHHHYHRSCRSQSNPPLLNPTVSQQKITFEKNNNFVPFHVACISVQSFCSMGDRLMRSPIFQLVVSLNGVILYLQIINKRCRDIQSYFYHFHPSQQHPRAERGAKEVGVRHYRVRVVGPEQDSED